MICCGLLAYRYPCILGVIEEVADGYTVTVWLRTSAGPDGARIVADPPADTINEGRGIISKHARECWISDDDVEIDIRLGLGPSRGPTNQNPVPDNEGADL
jgi:hypothetical protein